MLKDKIKSFANDTLIYGTFQVLGRLFTFLLTPLYSNYLTPNENGILAFMLSVQVVALFVYIFGMEAAYFRFFSKNDEAHNKKVFTTAYITIGGISVLCSAVFLLFAGPLSAPIRELPHSLEIFQLTCLIPLFDCLAVIPYDRMRMERKLKHFAVLRFIIVVIATFLSSYFVMFASLGVRGALLGQVIASGLAFLYFSPQVVKMLDLRLDKTLFKEMLRFGMPIIPSNLSLIALQVADRPIMQMLLSSEKVGIYQVNAKLAVPMLMLVSIFDTAWKPFFLSHFEESDAKKLFSRILTYYLFVSSFLLLTVSFLMDYVVRVPIWDSKTFIHSDYWQGLDVVSIIMLGYLINGVTTNIASVFHIDKQTKYISLSVGLSAIFSLGLNFILLPLIGYVGAAVSLVCGYFVGMVSMKYWTRKSFYKIEYEGKRLIIIVIASSVVWFAGTFIASQFALLPALIIKCGLLVIYLFSLKLLGFFTKGELDYIRKLLKRR